MKQGKKTFKIVLIILSLVMLTGCTKTLTGEDKKAVKYEETGKALTENILCKPTNKDVIELYKEIETAPFQLFNFVGDDWYEQVNPSYRKEGCRNPGRPHHGRTESGRPSKKIETLILCHAASVWRPL